jgi:hypothetical protein
MADMTEEQGLELVRQVVSENSAAVRLVKELTKKREQLGLPSGASVDLALFVIQAQRETIEALQALVAAKDEIIELNDRLWKLDSP